MALSLSALEAAARGWVDTPYADNGCLRGVAASCHGLVWALYREAGWEHGLVLGDGPSRWSGRLDRSPLCEYMAGQRHNFDEISRTESVRPGDMVGMLVGCQIAHAALILPGGWLIHALRHSGVSVCPLIDPTWALRIKAVWRPRVPVIP